MSKHPLLHGARGERHVLLGNEAIVRGALEAGVNMVTCYPGTPSSEVPDTFYKLGGEGRYKIEYAVNEKVAFEVAAGAVGCFGGRKICFFFGFGENADSLLRFKLLYCIHQGFREEHRP